VNYRTLRAPRALFRDACIKRFRGNVDNISMVRTSTATNETTVLGHALEARVHDISRTVLETWHERAPQAAGAADPRVQEDILKTTEFATRLVSNFLLHGAVQSEEQARWLAATGKAPLRDTIALADLTKLYLYWRDMTAATIAAETTRLGIGNELRDEAIAIVRGGSDRSIVRMAKEFDVERQRLERELAIERKRLAHQAHHDPLTGLPNRRLFFDRLQHALDLTERQPARLALIYIDVDDFKAVNDRYGHGIGDQVLITIAQRLAQATRTVDSIARLGGDEFVVLGEQLTEPESDAVTLARRIARRLSAPCDTNALRLSASIGIAIPRAPTTTDILIRLADEAMYNAKRDGPGQIRVAAHTQ
jgi:diguanylate cyclase (GGDEF)-like protein